VKAVLTWIRKAIQLFLIRLDPKLRESIQSHLLQNLPIKKRKPKSLQMNSKTSVTFPKCKARLEVCLCQLRSCTKVHHRDPRHRTLINSYRNQFSRWTQRQVSSSQRATTACTSFQNLDLASKRPAINAIKLKWKPICNQIKTNLLIKCFWVGPIILSCRWSWLMKWKVEKMYCRWFSLQEAARKKSLSLIVKTQEPQASHPKLPKNKTVGNKRSNSLQSQKSKVQCKCFYVLLCRINSYGPHLETFWKMKLS
jgi:hypothetical protein